MSSARFMGRRKTRPRIEKYDVEIIRMEKGCIEAFVPSMSQPDLKHYVVVTENGAECDCQGVLRVDPEDFCVHVYAVLDRAKTINPEVVNEIIDHLTEKIEVEKFYVETGSFIDAFGGLVSGDITLFYGPNGSGKSTGAMTIAAKFSEHLGDEKIVYVNTETGDPLCRFNKRFMMKISPASVRKTIFYAPKTQNELHGFLGGREKVKTKTLKDILRENEVALLIVDSVTAWYNIQVNNAPSQQRPAIASRFAGKLGIWVRHLYRLMLNSKPFPVIFTAWMKSAVGDALKKAETDVKEMVSTDALKEWTGPRALGYWSKVIYKVLPAGARRCTYTQMRGEHEGKQILCEISKDGVKLIKEL